MTYEDWCKQFMAFVNAAEWQLTKAQVQELYSFMEEAGELVHDGDK